jgi:hypothetical protein
MARQPAMPKAVSSLQSVQRLYISDSEAEKKKRKGAEEFKESSRLKSSVDGQ